MVLLCEELQKQANPEKARVLQKFFKTGKGQYGEGDVFIGLTVPDCRLIAKKFAHIELKEVEKHLQSKLHEERLVALLILVEKYQKNIANRKSIFDFYLANLKYVNN
ncbi:MAG: DNA alkylation repair protein, partial [Patescibacteria group bacterium]